MEAAVDQQELIAVDESQLDVNRVAVHVAVKGQLVLAQALECELGFPVLIAAVLGERKSLGFTVDRDAVRHERIVHALKSHPRREVENSAPPAIVIGEERRAELSVNRDPVHIPDAVKWRFNTPSAVYVPIAPAAIDIHSYKRDTENDLHGQCDAVGAKR